MVFAKQLEESLFKFAPKELAYEGDNVGLLIENKKEVTGVLCALDITQDVVKEAIKLRCNVIVSHHPVIFRPLYSIAAGSVVSELIKNDIAAICMHTNADSATDGVNDIFSDILKLKNVTAFGDGLGRIGELEREMSAKEFADLCEKLFDTCRATRYGGSVKKVAVVGGSGGDYMIDAFECGADAFVTGEAAHHWAIAANHAGKMLVTAGHFETERMIVNKFASYLKAYFNMLSVRVSENEVNPYTIKY